MLGVDKLCISYVLFADIFSRSFNDFISMKFLMAVFLPASPFIPTCPSINFIAPSLFITLTETCQSARLFRPPFLFEARECKDHQSETLFMFTIFLTTSRRRSIYVLTIWYIFHFHLHFHKDQSYNLINTGALVFLLIFRNMSYYLWMIMWMKNVNHFQIVKVQSQGVA